MKRGVTGHTKFLRLKARLGLPTYAVAGVLECLWHLTARQAPRGDIGRLPNEDIALWLEWGGDADALVDALVLCGWLDVDPECRLVVHDWHDHADDATKKALHRGGKAFASVQQCADKIGNGPSVSGHVATSPDMSRLPEPEPEPEPEPRESGAAPARTAAAASKTRRAVGAQRALPMSDDEFVFKLKANAAYSHCDVDLELGRMDAWLAAHPGRKKSRQFVVNWLNRIDKPLGGTHGPTNGNGTRLGLGQRPPAGKAPAAGDDPWAAADAINAARGFARAAAGGE